MAEEGDGGWGGRAGMMMMMIWRDRMKRGRGRREGREGWGRVGVMMRRVSSFSCLVKKKTTKGYHHHGMGDDDDDVGDGGGGVWTMLFWL